MTEIGKQRIMIGIPCYESVAAQTLEDYMRFAFYLGRRYQEYDFFLFVKPKSEQFRARNALVQAALDVGAKWLLMLDDDHIIDVDATSGTIGEGAGCYGFLRKLLDHDVDIVGPTYYQRGGQAGPVVMEERDGAYRLMHENELTGGLQEVGVQGGGCMLIKMHIFDKIKQPWFKPEHNLGTDIQLCESARNAGFKVYTDSSIQIGHIMQERIIVTQHNKDRFREDALKQGTASLTKNWHTDSVLNLYRDDALEYLGIKEHELLDLYTDYAEVSMKLTEKHGLGTPEYYGGMGKEQIARQVLYHYTDFPKKWMSFALANIQIRQPLTGIDFGCGTAPIGFELTRRGHTMHFFDIDGAGGFEFLKWRIKKYGLEDRAFFNEWPEEANVAYALFSDILEHLHNWEKPIERTVEKFIPQGVFFTNYLLLSDDIQNVEHINWRRGEFVKYMYDLGMEPVSNCVFMYTKGGATHD